MKQTGVAVWLAAVSVGVLLSVGCGDSSNGVESAELAVTANDCTKWASTLGTQLKNKLRSESITKLKSFDDKTKRIQLDSNEEIVESSNLFSSSAYVTCKYGGANAPHQFGEFVVAQDNWKTVEDTCKAIINATAILGYLPNRKKKEEIKQQACTRSGLKSELTNTYLQNTYCIDSKLAVNVEIRGGQPVDFSFSSPLRIQTILPNEDETVSVQVDLAGEISKAFTNLCSSAISKK